MEAGITSVGSTPNWAEASTQERVQVRVFGSLLVSHQRRLDSSMRHTVVDDQVLVWDGLAVTVGHQDNIEDVAEGQMELKAIEAARRHHPDLILLDIRLEEPFSLPLSPIGRPAEKGRGTD